MPNGNRKLGFENGQTYLGRLTDLGVRRTAADIDPFWRELKVIFDQSLLSRNASIEVLGSHHLGHVDLTPII